MQWSKVLLGFAAMSLHPTQATCFVRHARTRSQRPSAPKTAPLSTLHSYLAASLSCASSTESGSKDSRSSSDAKTVPSHQLRTRVPAGPRCCADPQGDADGAALLQAIWRAARARLPPLITGAGVNDGNDNPAGALFNMVLIRLPFLLACAALIANVLLGVGVVVGSFVWPLVGYDDGTGLIM